MKPLAYILIALALCGAASAQNSALNIDDIAPTNSGSPPIGWANPPCFGAPCAGGTGVLVNTTLTTAVAVTGSQNVKVVAINGMIMGNSVVVDTGAKQEVVSITSIYDGGVNSPGFQAAFTKTHLSGVIVQGFLQTINNPAPSLDGEAMQLSNYGEAQSNLLWFYNNAPQDGAAFFYDDQWLYLDANGSTGNALEYDNFQYSRPLSCQGQTGTRFMYGQQCDLNHHLWDVWNSFTGSWVATTLACNPSTLSWHHLIRATYRVPGDTSCTGGCPCMHYPYVVIDGVKTQLNAMQSAGGLPSNFAEQTGTQDQLDVGASGLEQTEWVDEWNFYTVATGAPFFTSTATSASFAIGTVSSVTIAALGVPAPGFTETGSLPTGLTFTDNGNGTATLSGSPSTGTGGTYSLSFTASNTVSPNATLPFTLTVIAPILIAKYPALPQIWVDNNEWFDNIAFTPPAYELLLGSPGSWVGTAPSGCSFTLANYTANGVGAQNAQTDLEICKTAKSGAFGAYVDVPAGATISTTNGFVVTQSASSQSASSFIVFRSAMDSQLAALPEPVCAGGTEDNLPTSTEPGLNNPDCTGGNLYFDLGPTNVSGTIFGRTTLSVTTTTLAAISPGTSVHVALANGFVAPGISVTVDSGGSAETVTTISCVNQDGMCANFSNSHSSGVIASYSPANFTLANGTVSSPAAYNYAQYMWSLTCTAINCTPLLFCSPTATGGNQCAGSVGPDHWAILDALVSGPVGSTGQFNIIGPGDAANQTNTTQYATHIHLRRVAALGDWTSLLTGANHVTTAFNLSACVNCSVVGSQSSQILSPTNECHAAIGNGTTYKWDNNWLEGCSSGLFAGGYSSGSGPSIFGFVPFQDVEIRRNRITFPYSWLGVMKVPAGNPNYSSGTASIVRKNCNEWKENERIVFDGNICENVDNSGGQNGTVAVINVRNTSNVGLGTNYQSTINDDLLSNNIYRNACEGIELAGRSSGVSGNGGGVSHPINRLWLHNILHYGITNTNPGCSGVGAFGIQMSSAGQSWTGNITCTSLAGSCTFVATTSVDAAAPVSTAIGFQAMDISAGDSVAVSGCTAVPSFNSPTHTISGHVVPTAIGYPVSVGSSPWTGTFTPTNATVIFNQATSGNPADNSGRCTLTNIQGAPQNVILDHHTLITDAVQSIGNGNTPTSGPNFQTDHLLRDSIFLSAPGATNAGWYNSSLGEGVPTETFNYDSSSMTASYLAWPGRNSAKYLEYGNNPLFPDASCSTLTGCSPTSWGFPANSYCPGAVSPLCVGFTGAINSSKMPLTLPDYHGYALSPLSSFHNTASDGTDRGTLIPLLDAAFILNTYVCPLSCGSPGPYPDQVAVIPPPMSKHAIQINGTIQMNGNVKIVP